MPFARADGDVVAVFSGAFRAWHGAIHLVEAIRRLRARGRPDIKAVFIGDGPSCRACARQPPARRHYTHGAVPHEDVPAILAAADIGVAPFDVAAHPSLAHEFHWSPLKIFEYMASGLPVVAPRIERLADIVSDGSEGLALRCDGSRRAGVRARAADRAATVRHRARRRRARACGRASSAGPATAGGSTAAIRTRAERLACAS